MITTTLPTPNGRRYLQQLCKHWSHKFETDFTLEQGRIDLPLGPVLLAANDETLTLSLDPADGADIARFKQVVEDHLDRFAFRETPLPYDWQESA